MPLASGCDAGHHDDAAHGTGAPIHIVSANVSTTQSIVMRSKSGTVRMIEAYHRLSKLNEYSAIDFTGDSSAAYPLP